MAITLARMTRNPLTDDQFLEMCQSNRDLRFERSAEGEVTIMAPTGGETGSRNAILNAFLTVWALQDGSGLTFDSSTGFTLPNGATRSPDAAWVRRSRLAALTSEQKRRFLPLCPDFVIELKSESDALSALQAKMQEYLDQGAQLGWLIDPEQRQVHVYRDGQRYETLDNPGRLSDEALLPGLVLDLQRIWEPNF